MQSPSLLVMSAVFRDLIAEHLLQLTAAGQLCSNPKRTKARLASASGCRALNDVKLGVQAAVSCSAQAVQHRRGLLRTTPMPMCKRSLPSTVSPADQFVSASLQAHHCRHTSTEIAPTSQDIC